MAISLADVQVGASHIPPRLIIYGVEGIGKSVLAAMAQNPIFVQTEDGLDGAMPDKTPIKEYLSANGGGYFPLSKTYSEVHEALIALATEDHAYKTLALDSLDWLETLIWKHVIANNPTSENGRPITSIEDYGYGKGYGLALDVWVDFIKALNFLREAKGMTVILTAHSEVKQFNDPTTEPYDKYRIKLHKAASGKMREWADVIGFCNYRVSTTQSDTGFNQKKTRAVGAGDRLLFTEERPQFEAKNRFTMPAEMPLTWANVAAAIPYLSQSNQAANAAA